MIPDYVISLLDQFEIAGAVLGKAACVFAFALLAFTYFKISPFFLEFLLQYYGDTSTDALKLGHIMDLLLNPREHARGMGHTDNT